VRTGCRLEADARESRNFRQVLLQLVQQMEQALQRRFRLIRVQINDARKPRHALVPFRIVLHRAGTERIEVGIDRHVQRRQIGIVPHDFRLGQFRQWRQSSGTMPLRNQFSQGSPRHVARGQYRSAAPGAR
jgi:hypothetical protein